MELLHDCLGAAFSLIGAVPYRSRHEDATADSCVHTLPGRYNEGITTLQVLTTTFTFPPQAPMHTTAKSEAASIENLPAQEQTKSASFLSRMLKAISNSFHSFVSASGALLTRDASRSTLDREFGSTASLVKIRQLDTSDDFLPSTKPSPNMPSQGSPNPTRDSDWLHKVYLDSLPQRDASSSSAARGISTVERAEQLASRVWLRHDQTIDERNDTSSFDTVSYNSDDSYDSDSEVCFSREDQNSHSPEVIARGKILSSNSEQGGITSTERWQSMEAANTFGTPGSISPINEDRFVTPTVFEVFRNDRVQVIDTTH